MISQIDLIAGIGKLLTPHGVETVLPRQFDAIVTAANGILAELAKPYTPATPGCGLKAWLESDDTGMSSLWMANVMRGVHRQAEVAWPHDPDDLRRCVTFLDAVQGTREQFPGMTVSGPQWAALVAAWDELESLLREEEASGKCPKLTKRMKEILGE